MSRTLPIHTLQFCLLTEHRIGDNSAYIRRKRGGGWEEADRLYGVVREKSIGYPRKVYRHFSDRTVQTIRYLTPNVLFPSYKRSVTSHSPLCYLRTNDPIPPILCSASFVHMIRYLLFPALTAPILRLSSRHPRFHLLRTNDPTPSILRP